MAVAAGVRPECLCTEVPVGSMSSLARKNIVFQCTETHLQQKSESNTEKITRPQVGAACEEECSNVVVDWRAHKAQRWRTMPACCGIFRHTATLPRGSSTAANEIKFGTRWGSGRG